MTDPRYTKLARLLVEYSTALKKGERALIDTTDVPAPLTDEKTREVKDPKTEKK